MIKFLTKKVVKRVGAAALCAVVIAGGVIGVGYGTGLFNDGEDISISSTIDEGSGLVVGDSIGKNMKITTATVGPTASTYTLTATITPAYATYTDITWSLAWDTTFSGYVASGESEDINGEGWIDDIVTVDISDYVTLSSTTGSSVTVTCVAPFGNPIIVTATSDDNSTIKASCQLDYHSRITSVSLYNADNITLSSTSSSDRSVGYTCDYTIGTILYDLTVTYEVIGRGDWFNDMILDYSDYGLSLYHTSYSDWKAEETIVDGTTSSVSLSLFSFSLYWSDFVEAQLADGIESDDGYIIDFYTIMSNLDLIGKTLSTASMYYIKVVATDNFSGESYSVIKSLCLTSLDDYPTFSVTNVALNQSQVIF